MELQGNRRWFLVGAAAVCGGLLVPPARAVAAAFAPTRFSVEVVGAGPDVILVPGLGSSRQVWRPTVAAIPGYRYHLLQLGGFGGEPVRDNVGGMIAAGAAEQLAQYIFSRGLKRPAVIGHSMGGTIGMLLALRYPNALGRLMVVDMLPQPAAMIGSSAEQIGPIADNLRLLAEVPRGRELLGALVGLFGVPADPNVRNDPDVVARSAHELATTDLRRELPRLTAPTTIVYASPGARQGAAVDAIYKSAYRTAPRAKFVRIDDSGHLVMADRPAEFRRAMREFLRESR